MLEAQNLFHKNRFPESILKLFMLITYFPIGLGLIGIRFIVGLFTILLASALPDVSVVRYLLTKLFCFTLGVIVRAEGEENKDKSAKIVVSNHVSNLDHLALHVATDSLTPTQYKMHELIQNSLGYININRSQITYDMIQNNENQTKFAIFPEEAITNGKGLLKFKPSVFEFDDVRIQPVAINVSRPLITEINVTCLGADWATNMITYLFVPYTIYDVKILPSKIKEDNMTVIEFVEQIREAIASNLKIPTTDLTSRDLMDYQKRFIVDNRQSQGSSSNAARSNQMPGSSSSGLTRNARILQMARQVKDVLPTVPLNVIIKDLEKSLSVDQTVANILDGKVSYTPEPPPSTSAQSNSSTVAAINLAANFSKSPVERMTTFQQRKRELIENARRKYMLKHGLTDSVLIG